MPPRTPLPYPEDWTVAHGLDVYLADNGFSLAFGFVHSPIRTWRSLRAATVGRTLFSQDIARDFSRLLALTIGELRDELGLPRQGLVRTLPS